MKKEYCLVNKSARESIDLIDYKNVIENAYAKVNKDLIIRVHSNFYEVIGNLTKRQAIEAGKIIAKSTLGMYSVKYPINSINPSTVQLFRGKIATL